MADPLARHLQGFDRRSLRERALIALTLLVGAGVGWWHYQAAPALQRLADLDRQNRQIVAENDETRGRVADIRQRIAGGVYREKIAELDRLGERLDGLERELRQKTIELVPPEKMFELMNRLLLRDSRLTLQRLVRREVRPAIPREEPAADNAATGIYRHVIEIELSGRYLDILAYMQTLEALDWKLLWDEIEIRNDAFPRVDVRLVMSTLSTERQWIGI